jgi:hypothetical protein
METEHSTWLKDGMNQLIYLNFFFLHIDIDIDLSVPFRVLAC